MAAAFLVRASDSAKVKLKNFAFQAMAAGMLILAVAAMAAVAGRRRRSKSVKTQKTVLFLVLVCLSVVGLVNATPKT